MATQHTRVVKAIAHPFDNWFWIQVIFYAVNLVIFYGFIVMPIGLEIRSKCMEFRGIKNSNTIVMSFNNNNVIKIYYLMTNILNI